MSFERGTRMVVDNKNIPGLNTKPFIMSRMRGSFELTLFQLERWIPDVFNGEFSFRVSSSNPQQRPLSSFRHLSFRLSSRIVTTTKGKAATCFSVLLSDGWMDPRTQGRDVDLAMTELIAEDLRNDDRHLLHESIMLSD